MTEEEFQEREAEKEQKKAERSRNAANNAQVLRTAAKVAKNTPEGITATVGTVVDAADKLTGGATTNLLGHAMNVVTPKPIQGAINTAAESGALNVANKALDGASGAAGKPGNPAGTESANATNQNNKPSPPATPNINNKNSETATEISGNIDVETSGTKKVVPIVIIGIVALPILLILFLIISIVAVVLVPFTLLAENPGDKMNDLSTIIITNPAKYAGEIDFEDYIAGIIAADTTYVHDLEYYKYAATVIRTDVLANTFSNEVDGNNSKFKYIDVEESPYSDLIKQAVDETTGIVIAKEEMLNYDKVNATVSDSNETSYTIEYGLKSKELKKQTISKDWEYISTFSNYLDNQNSQNSSYDITKILAAYLITYEQRSYEDTIKLFYDDVSVVDANTITTGTLVNGFITPVQNFSCSNGYGCRFHPIHKTYQMHNGVDLGAASGEPVYAAKAGTIKHVTTNVPGYSTSQGYGNYITIEHDDGSQTRYAHLLYQSIPSSISVGTRVQQGQMIGKVGSTGASTGPHLHYEIFVNGSRVNPYNYMDLTNAGNSAQKCNSNASTPMSYCGF